MFVWGRAVGNASTDLRPPSAFLRPSAMKHARRVWNVRLSMSRFLDCPHGTIGGVFHRDTRLEKAVTHGIRAGEIPCDASLLTLLQEAFDQGDQSLPGRRSAAGAIR